MQKSDRIDYIDAAKGIGIVLVVVGHFYDNKEVISWIYSFHMPLFFIISGFLYQDEKKEIYTHVKQKTESLMWPYFTFSVFTIIWGGFIGLYCMDR